MTLSDTAEWYRVANILWEKNRTVDRMFMIAADRNFGGVTDLIEEIYALNYPGTIEEQLIAHATILRLEG